MIFNAIMHGGGSALFEEYETGVWSPTSDVTTPRTAIPFAKTHDTPPAFVIMQDTDLDTLPSSAMSFSFAIDYKSLSSGATLMEGSTIGHYCYIAKSTGSYYVLKYSAKTNSASDVSYFRYWADESNLYAVGGASNRKWCSDRTYKWIAAWR